ncbi:Uncharacterised protein [Yersinia intermedia]|nr:Uncharacterised protein [Yersinia intermedia]CNH16821.1 Uncharacterised protein [Yersinia intermedia]CQJ66967.1 Uncharacterised protein [Yersinia intermedia]
MLFSGQSFERVINADFLGLFICFFFFTGISTSSQYSFSFVSFGSGLSESDIGIDPD